MRFRYLLSNLSILLFIFCFAFPASGQVPPNPLNYITDLAGIVDNDVEIRLNGYLKELEQKTTVQIMVLTLISLEGAAIEDLAISIAHDKWKIGEKGKDNGAFLLVAHKDRKYRFEIGYGLEGILPDSLVGSIGRMYLVPNFQKEDYSRGIYEGVMAMIQPIAEDAGIQLSNFSPGQTHFPGREESAPSTLLSKVISFLFFLGLIFLFIRHPRLLLFLFLMGSMGGRGGSSWGSGGGGFGGGRGGGFGGGGASGGW